MHKLVRAVLPAALILFSLTSLSLPARRSAAKSVGASRQTQTQTTAPSPSPTPARDERLWKRAQELHRKAFVLDGHNDITEIMVDTGYDIGTPSVGKYHTDLARLVRSGMTGQFFSVYIDRKYATDGGSARRALDLIDVIYRAAEKYTNE